MRTTNREVEAQIGQRIRAARIAAGLSQERLADALGLTFQQVQKYEKGTNRVAASRLVAIAEVLGTTAPALLGLGDAQPPAVVSMMATREGHALAEAFNRISSGSDRHFISRLAERFAMVSIITARDFGAHQAAE